VQLLFESIAGTFGFLGGSRDHRTDEELTSKGVRLEGLFPLNSIMALEPLDTSVTAQDLQEQAHIRLGPEGRLRIALDLSEAVRDLRLAGLRSSEPDVSEAELVRRFIRETHGLKPEGLL
jgi:hypothetical protein